MPQHNHSTHKSHDGKQMRNRVLHTSFFIALLLLFIAPVYGLQTPYIYFKLNSASNNTVIDFMNRTNGTNQGATPNMTGYFLESYKTGSSLAVQNNINTSIRSDLINETRNFSITVWANLSDPYTQRTRGLFSNSDATNKGFGIVQSCTLYNGVIEILDSTTCKPTTYNISSRTNRWIFYTYTQYYNITDDRTYVAVYANTSLILNYTIQRLDVDKSILLGAANARYVVGNDWNGTIDEFRFFNKTLSVSEIYEVFNETVEWGTDTTINYLNINITTGNNTHENVFNFTYYMNTSIAGAIDCDIYINNTIWESGWLVNDTDYYYQNLTFGDGNYSYYVNCTSGSTTNTSQPYNMVIDTLYPVISITEPDMSNSTVLNASLNITGTVSDSYLYRVNVSISNSSGDYLYNVFYDSIAASTQNITNKSINITAWAEGTYTLFVEATDSHTGLLFDEDIITTKSNSTTTLYLKSAQLSFTTPTDTTLSFMKAADRFNYQLSSAKTGIQKNMLVTSSLPFRKIEKSAYPCHYVFGSYWIDAQGLSNPVCTVLNNGYALNIAYMQDSTTLMAKSIGGLNIINATILFNISRPVSAPAANVTNATSVTINMIDYSEPIYLFIFTFLWLVLLALGILVPFNLLTLLSGFGFIFTGLNLDDVVPMLKILYIFVGAAIILVWGFRGFAARNI